MATLEAAIEISEEQRDEVWIELAKERYHDFYEFMNRDEGYEMSPHQNLIGDLLMASASKQTMPATVRTSSPRRLARRFGRSSRPRITKKFSPTSRSSTTCGPWIIGR
jgi:hypothetical protein